MSSAYGLKCLSTASAANPHILGYSAARTGATDLLLDLWNGPNVGTRAVAVQKDGNVWAGNGAAATPAYSFVSDTDSGLYRIGADNVGIAVGGSKVVDVAAAGVAVTGTLSASGAVTLSSTAAITGNATVGGTLGVTGAVALSSTLTATGQIQGTTGNGFLDLAGDSGATKKLRLTDDGVLLLGDTANAAMAVGITIMHAGVSGYAFAVKRNTVNTGLTTSVHGFNVETDDLFAIEPGTGTAGGATIKALAETSRSSPVFSLESYGGAVDTDKSTSARALIELFATAHDGSNTLTGIAADGNVLAVRALVSPGLEVCRMLVDEDGDLYTATAGQTFDSEDDVSVLRAFQFATAPDKIVHNEFDRFVRHNEADLIRLGVLGAPVADGGMWNLTQHTRLLTGATWQLHTRQEQIRTAVRALLENNPSIAGADDVLALLN